MIEFYKISDTTVRDIWLSKTKFYHYKEVFNVNTQHKPILFTYTLLWSEVRKFIQLKLKILSRNGVSNSNSNNEIAYFKHFIFFAFILFACHKSEKDAYFSDCSWASRNSRGIRNSKLRQSFIARSSLKLVQITPPLCLELNFFDYFSNISVFYLLS